MKVLCWRMKKKRLHKRRTTGDNRHNHVITLNKDKRQRQLQQGYPGPENMADAMTGPGYFYVAINESQLLHAFGTPQLPPAFVIRAIALLTHAGLVAK